MEFLFHLEEQIFMIQVMFYKDCFRASNHSIRTKHGYISILLYENVLILKGIKEPLIIVTPNKNNMINSRSRKEDSLVSLLDIMPTILDWHGVPIPANLTGKSLLPYAGKCFKAYPTSCQTNLLKGY